MKYSLPCYALLLLVVLALAAPGFTERSFADTDAAVHAMDGLFFLDLLRDLPAPGALKRYAVEYYARYPSLGLVIYPPLLPMLLAPLYALGGASAPVARAAVVLFALLNAAVFFRLLERRLGSLPALLATLFLVTNVEMVRWSREVMLEVPAIFFLNLAATAWLAATENGRARAYLVAFLALLAAIHTKQTAGFLLAVFLVHGVLQSGFRAFIRRKRMLLPLALFFLLLAPLGLATMRYGYYGTVQLTPSTYGRSALTLDNWLTWARLLPLVVSPGVIVLAGCGLLHVRRPGVRNLGLFMAAWFAVWYLAFSWLPIKTLRFGVFAVPPLAALAGILLAQNPSRLLRLAAAALALFLAARGLLEPVPFVRGYEPAAAWCASIGDGRPVLFDGYHSADFVFHARAADPHRRMIVLRGSKMLSATASGALKVYPVIETETGLVEMLQRYAVQRIVIEDRVDPTIELPHTRWLRRYLAAGPFVVEKEFPLETNIPFLRARRIVVYRYRDAVAKPAGRTLEIFVPSAGMTVKADILQASVQAKR